MWQCRACRRDLVVAGDIAENRFGCTAGIDTVGKAEDQIEQHGIAVEDGPSAAAVDLTDGAVRSDLYRREYDTVVAWLRARAREGLTQHVPTVQIIGWVLREDQCTLLRRKLPRFVRFLGVNLEHVALPDRARLAAHLGVAIINECRCRVAGTFEIADAERHGRWSGDRSAVGTSAVVGGLAGVNWWGLVGHDDLTAKLIDRDTWPDADAAAIGSGDDVESTEDSVAKREPVEQPAFAIVVVLLYLEVPDIHQLPVEVVVAGRRCESPKPPAR